MASSLGLANSFWQMRGADEAAHPQGGASRQGIVIHIVPFGSAL